MNQVKTITRVATQGRSSSYVMTYTVSHSKSALWEAYLENNAVKVRQHECDNSGTFHGRLPQGTVTRATETCNLFCTLLQNELNSDVGRFTSHDENLSCNLTNEVVAGCEMLLQQKLFVLCVLPA